MLLISVNLCIIMHERLMKVINGLKNVRILTPEGFINGNLQIDNGKITNINYDPNFNGLTFTDVVTVVPGFIDEHIHGANGSDVMDGDLDSLSNIACTIVKEGVTSFLATTMTQKEDVIIKALNNVKEYVDNPVENGAEVIGIHLEGPFLNPSACGAQDPAYIVNPDVDKLKRYQDASGNLIKLVTVAPEMPGGIEFIKYCTSAGIVASIGHTKATYEDAHQAVLAGATNVTHCFNAMSGLHHRDVGVVGAALLHDELTTELIADGIHVSKEAIKILYKLKGKDKLTLVTDAMEAKWLPDGEYELGGQKVYVKGKEARLTNGTLAGSVLKMNEAVGNMHDFLDATLEDIIYMASVNPAKKLGVYDRKGSIEPGKDADLVVLNDNLEVIMTIVKGRICYCKE